jgi:hypothetical protein
MIALTQSLSFKLRDWKMRFTASEGMIAMGGGQLMIRWISNKSFAHEGARGFRDGFELSLECIALISALCPAVQDEVPWLH